MRVMTRTVATEIEKGAKLSRNIRGQDLPELGDEFNCY